MKAMRIPRRKGPAEPVHAVRRTGQPGPSFNYELFNCNNFNIRYWSWNYRGCWPSIPDGGAPGWGRPEPRAGGISTYLKWSHEGIHRHPGAR